MIWKLICVPTGDSGGFIGGGAATLLALAIFFRQPPSSV